MPRLQTASIRELIDSLIEVEKVVGPDCKTYTPGHGGMVLPVRPEVLGKTMIVSVDKQTGTRIVYSRGVPAVLIRN